MDEPRRAPLCLCVALVATALGCGGVAAQPSATAEAEGNSVGATAPARTLSVSYVYPAHVSAAAAADLRGNRADEMIVVGQAEGTSSLAVWAPVPAGSLVPASTATYPVEGQGVSVAVADVTGDGVLDVLVGAHASPGAEVTLFAGQGGGTLRAASTSDVAGADLLATGDLDGDGRADAIAASSSTAGLTVLLGGGDGTLITAGSWTLPAVASAVALFDVDGDGALDVVARSASGSMDVLFGDGSGGFRAAGTLSAQGSFSPSPIPVRLPGGASPDETAQMPPVATGPMLVAGRYGSGGAPGIAFVSGDDIDLLVQNGKQGMLAAQQIGYSPTSVAAFDFEGNGRDDIAQVEPSTSSTAVTVLGLDAQGSLQPMARCAVEVPATGAVPGDFDGDGSVDLALVSPTSVTLLLNVPAPDAG